MLLPDLAKWQFWWEFNKDRFLHVKAPRLDKSQSDAIVATLTLALEGSTDHEIVSSALLALAKVGRNDPEAAILPLFQPRLLHPHPQVREAAILAMGISGRPSALRVLHLLARDSRAGRALLVPNKVDHRTRAFALFALGVLATRCPKIETKRKILVVLRSVLLEPGPLGARPLRNILVAAIHGISMLNLPGDQRSVEEQKLLDEAFFTLTDFEDRRLGRGPETILAHIPTAIVRLIGLGTTLRHDRYKAKLCARLKPRPKPTRRWHRIRSAALALGKIALPAELNQGDAVCSEVLRQYFKTGRDYQARNFCLLALGQIGGEANRVWLSKVLTTGKKSLERPWAGIALGVLEFNRRAVDPRADTSKTGELLLKQIHHVKTPESRAAFAVALGLCRHRPATRPMLILLSKYRSQDEFCGYLSVGLGLMGAKAAAETILKVARMAIRRPWQLRQSASALGQLGYQPSAAFLVARMRDRHRNSTVVCGISVGLGWLGGPKTVAELSKVLHDETLPEFNRASAATALGRIGERGAMPWNSHLAADVNYRALVETMNQHETGVLDIL